MTELLSALLHDEADGLVPSPPPSGAVLARGRGLRRRRRIAQALVALSVAAAVAGTALAYAGRGDQSSAVDPAGTGTRAVSPASGAVFSIGPTVYLDDGRVSARVDDVTVKSLYYTSAGVLVRHGNNNDSDGGGPQRFSLVSPEGTVTPVGVTTEETVHATDPEQPLLAYAQEVDGVVHVLVHDVVTDQQVADVPVPGDRADFSPLSIAGDLVRLGDGDTVHVVDWRTGEVTDSVDPGGWAVSGGRATTVDGTGIPRDVDAVTGEVLLVGPRPTSPDERGYLTLSPDGTHALYNPQTADQTTFDVYDVSTREHVSITGDPYDFGWSPDDTLFSVGPGGELTSCSTATAVCTTTALDLPVDPGGGQGDFSSNLQLGGRTYES